MDYVGVEAAKRPNEGRLTRCVWAALPASIRRRMEECARVHGHTDGCVSVLYAPVHRRWIVHCVPSDRWARKDGRLRGAERSGVARRGAASRAWKTAKTEAGRDPPSVSGPRQLTTAGRKSFYVFILAKPRDPFFRTCELIDAEIRPPIRRLVARG